MAQRSAAVWLPWPGGFLSFMDLYTKHFWVYNRDQSQNALAYLKGLTTVNPIKIWSGWWKSDPEADYQSVQQFITAIQHGRPGT
jgi:hypothetical protein